MLDREIMTDWNPVFIERDLQSGPATGSARWIMGWGLAILLAQAASVAVAQPAGLQGAIKGQLEAAGANRGELEQALAAVPASQRESLEFLIAWMPPDDARSLTAARLLEEVRLAEEVRGRLPWQKHIPDGIFRNHVLPYACLDEPRDPWRAEFLERFWPLVSESRSAGEAAQILNREIFRQLNVRYSTERQRANQSPAESIAQGLASCSGLSILLVDACRAVGVPARIAGIPRWPNKPGNHTWVEIWDGAWHFTGAAEYDPAGLDRAWFTGDAALAKPEDPRFSIYATQWEPTGIHYPLVWNRANRTIPAENVTQRYLPATPQRPAGEVRVFFRAVDEGGRRVACAVEVRPAGDDGGVAGSRASGGKDAVDGGSGAATGEPGGAAESTVAGTTIGEEGDRNHLLELSLRRNWRYELAWKSGNGASGRFEFQTREGLEQTVEWRVHPPARQLPEQPAAGGVDEEAVLAFARQWFAAEPADRAALESAPIAQDVPGDSLALRRLLWRALLESGRLDRLRDDLAASRITSGEHVSPWTIKDVGERPAGGWPLVIAMHGGGNVPQELNDSQWRHMQVYYRDHPEAGGYRYLALRAPNNTWNGFYDDYVYPLVMDLIAQQVAWNDVDPDRVYLIGYSHGGYGAFAIGPKMPDLFAAIHASASAGTDGESEPDGLHSTRFTWMVGGRDTAYGRRERCEKFEQAINALRGDRWDRYPARFFLVERNGHTGLPDRDWLVRMLPYVRNPVPRELDWLMTDPVVRHHYWLEVEAPAKGQRVTARLAGNNRIEVATEGCGEVIFHLDERHIDLSLPVCIVWRGTETLFPVRPSLADLCGSLLARRDVRLAGSVRIAMEFSQEAEKKQPRGEARGH